MKLNNGFSGALVVLLVIAGFVLASYVGVFAPEGATSGSPGEGTAPSQMGTVKVGSDRFEFDPTQVETVRPDLFNPGHFSVFDVLVHVAKQGGIDLEYHFDESMNTHVIDSIDGESEWPDVDENFEKK